MKVNILPNILKGGGGRDKGGNRKGGGKDREGVQTGRGDTQAVVGGSSLSVGARCPRALVMRWRGSSVSEAVDVVRGRRVVDRGQGSSM
jgi:hypothetical protein